MSPGILLLLLFYSVDEQLEVPKLTGKRQTLAGLRILLNHWLIVSHRRFATEQFSGIKQILDRAKYRIYLHVSRENLDKNWGKFFQFDLYAGQTFVSQRVVSSNLTPSTIFIH